MSRDANGRTNRTTDTGGRERSVEERVVVARRVDPGETQTAAEARRLARAAGYEVVETVTQARPRDPGTELGAGKVEEVAATVEAGDADAVVVDAPLTPAVTVELEDRVGVPVLDRHRVVLETFARGASTERARLGVELARLRHELPRVRERTGQHLLSLATEKGTPVQDYEARIARIERRLETLPSPAERHRERRREQGFDLVALVGYTNAGKSTLLRRLAADLSIDGDADPDPETEVTVSVADRLFETLETTTRRVSLSGRETLVTDTVGFVDDLPHELVASFSPTVAEAEAADCVVLTVDATDPPAALRRKLRTGLSVLDDAPEVVAFTKVDAVDAATVEQRRALVTEIADADLVPVSAVDGTGLETLRATVRERLPTERATVEMPAGDRAMQVVSAAYDQCRVHEVEYGDRVRLTVSGRPTTVERLRGRADGT